MHFLIYKITNLLDGKIYVGCHKTKNLEDGYSGSGRRIKSAIKKYGLENFKKEILFSCVTENEMFEKEREIVDEEFVSDQNTYNLRIGGSGGFSYINAVGINNRKPPHVLRRGTDSQRNHRDNNPDFWKVQHKKLSNFMVEKHKLMPESMRHFSSGSEAQIRAANNALSDKSRAKRIQTMRQRNHGVGNTNSQFGTVWVCRHDQPKPIKISSGELIEYLSLGWIRGRVVVKCDS